ncbi:MAG: P27 family phage terminase small subunit [Smithella sp.]
MTKENKNERWPECPDYLSEKAKALFFFYVGRTVKAPGQIALFIVGLEALDTFTECGVLIRQQGLSQSSQRSKMIRQHPLLNTQREAVTQVLKVWKELGLNLNIQRSSNVFGFEEIC